jgi:hypothetical protein
LELLGLALDPELLPLLVPEEMAALNELHVDLLLSMSLILQ